MCGEGAGVATPAAIRKESGDKSPHSTMRAELQQDGRQRCRRGCLAVRLFVRFLPAAAGVLLAGCGGREAPFRSNAVFLLKEETAAHVQLTDTQRDDIRQVLVWLFGTPDDPRLPELPGVTVAAVVDREQLRAAAGAANRGPSLITRGLYRQHCALCHGLTGDGAGPAAAWLSPYPRDFRRGVFKFKSTAGPGTPPTEADLERMLRAGNPGTPMPAFRRLPAVQRTALVQYTKYLAIRGLVERFLISLAVDELDEGQRLIDRTLADSHPETFQRQLEPVRAYLATVVQNWMTATDKVTVVPQRPVPADPEQAVNRGRELFRGNVANCVKCHGDAEQPASQAPDYDDWTKEIIDPGNPEAWRRYVAVGALRPVVAQPRELQHGIYHGGGEPAELYRRIHDGIAGTPMPAAAMRPEGAGAHDQRLSPEDVWHLVDYVLSLRGGPAAR
jgi:mono/diheme cytochrome c family protein